MFSYNRLNSLDLNFKNEAGFNNPFFYDLYFRFHMGMGLCSCKLPGEGSKQIAFNLLLHEISKLADSMKRYLRVSS